MKKKILCFSLMMAMCFTVLNLTAINAESSVFTVEGTLASKMSVYANGNDATIAKEEINGKTFITSGDSKVEINEKTLIYAGSSETGKTYETTNITMNSGTVNTIVGSNGAAGTIATSNITINGGKFGLIIGNQGKNSGGASSYTERKTYNVGTSNIVMNDGNGVGIIGSYGYTYVGTQNITVNKGTLSGNYATGSPSGIIGGSNGEIDSLNIKVNGGELKDISLTQRVMITNKANVEVNGGSVGNIYAGSFYDDTDNYIGTNEWANWKIGDVNYGQAAAIDIYVDKVAVLNDIYAGFQYLDKANYVTKFTKWLSNIEDSEKAALNITLGAIPKKDSTIKNTAHCRSLLSNPLTSDIQSIVYISDNIKDSVTTPPLDTSKPVDKVTIGLSDKRASEQLSAEVSVILKNIHTTSAVNDEARAKIEASLLKGNVLSVDVKVVEKTSTTEIEKNC